MNEDVSIGDGELRIILKNFLEFLEPNRDKIERDLRQFDFLVEIVEPYTSLYCLSSSKIPFDMNYCLKICLPKKIAECINMFYINDYLIKRVNKNVS